MNVWEFNVKGQHGVGQTDGTAFQRGYALYYEGMGESVTDEYGTSGTYTEPENGKTDFYSTFGWRDRTNGSVGAVGSWSYFWSSSPTGSSNETSGYFSFYTTYMRPLNNNSRAYGFPIRCVKEPNK